MVHLIVSLLGPLTVIPAYDSEWSLRAGIGMTINLRVILYQITQLYFSYE